MFRLVSYNIRAGLGMDGRRSIRRVAEVLAPLSPDIVCLQEVDRGVPRSWLANQPKYLGIRLGMQAVFQRNVIFSGDGGFGNCILLKSPVGGHCRCHRLPEGGEPRGLLEAKGAIDGQQLSVFCTHLALDHDVRVEQAKEITEILRSVPGPKVLCGDMNDVQGSQTLAALLDSPALRDAALEFGAGDIATYPQGPETRIDFILADLRLNTKSYQVLDSDASDHLPIIVDLEFA